jgi:hypothetical protein
MPIKSLKRKSVKVKRKSVKVKRKSVKVKSNPRGTLSGHVGQKTRNGKEYYVYIDTYFNSEIEKTMQNLKNNKDISIDMKKHMVSVINGMKDNSIKVISGIEVPVDWVILYNDSYKRIFPHMMTNQFEMQKRLTALRS